MHLNPVLPLPSLLSSQLSYLLFHPDSCPLNLLSQGLQPQQAAPKLLQPSLILLQPFSLFKSKHFNPDNRSPIHLLPHKPFLKLKPPNKSPFNLKILTYNNKPPKTSRLLLSLLNNPNSETRTVSNSPPIPTNAGDASLATTSAIKPVSVQQFPVNAPHTTKSQEHAKGATLVSFSLTDNATYSSVEQTPADLLPQIPIVEYLPETPAKPATKDSMFVTGYAPHPTSSVPQSIPMDTVFPAIQATL